MHDKFEVLIYILFIALSILGGLYKNYAKRKEEQAKKLKKQQDTRDYSEKRAYESEKNFQTTVEEKNQQESREPSRNPFEEFLRQQLEIVEEKEPEPEPVSEPIAQSPKEESLDSVGVEGSAVFESTSNELLSDNMQEQNFNISESIEAKEKSGEVYNYSYNKIAEDEISDKKPLREEFNGRKAVIYAEIIKRPDF